MKIYSILVLTHYLINHFLQTYDAYLHFNALLYQFHQKTSTLLFQFTFFQFLHFFRIVYLFHAIFIYSFIFILIEKHIYISYFFKIKLQMLDKLSAKIIFGLIIIMVQISSNSGVIKTRTNSDKTYISSNHLADTIYSIDVIRTDSSKQAEANRCVSTQRTIEVSKDTQIFRLGSASNNKERLQNILKILTELDDGQIMIEQFERVGDMIFVVTTKGNGYFINPNTTNSEAKQIKLGIQIHSSNSQEGMNIMIIDFNNNALVITNKKMVICGMQDSVCDEVVGNDQVKYLIDAKIFKQEAKTYLFLFPGKQILTYEISANGKLDNRRQYNSTFFQTAAIHIRTVEKGPLNTLIFLDSIKGLRQVKYNQQMNNFQQTHKIIYSQSGCYKMAAQKQGSYVVMSCSLNFKSFFIMELIRLQQFGTYEPQQTIFRRQSIHDIGIQEATIMSRVFSGIRFYWASKSLQKPYPYDYLHAGDIFLHNAIQSKIFINEGKQVVFIATEDQIRRYQLKLVEPIVICYSSIDIIEKYKLKYKFPCPKIPQNNVSKSAICQTEELLQFQAWEYKQVKVNTMLIPFIISLIGLIFIGCVMLKICKKFNQEVEKARLKYNTEEQFGLENN